MVREGGRERKVVREWDEQMGEGGGEKRVMHNTKQYYTAFKTW